MKLWRISQTENSGWDTYDSAVVAAETEEVARHTHPSNYFWHEGKWQMKCADGSWREEGNYGTWTSALHLISVEYIGDAKPGTEAGVICASFNAG